ncbi:del-4 [Pristionchus pacificus]|nr:del-4 [Pristionchus pacificus]
MGIFSKGLTFLLKDFACWTSTHGIPHIGGSNNIWLRLFWVVVVIGCVIGFLVQLKTLITKYLSYEVNTETKLAFEERPFPVVTICHMNPWKKGEAFRMSQYMQDLMTAYEAQTASTDFGFSAMRNGARQQRAMRLTTLASNSLFALSDNSTFNGTEIYPDPSYTYKDLVVSCTYNAATCNETGFFASYKDPTFGRCVQFNFDEYQNSSRAGPLYGLRLTLRAVQDQYLPWTESAGVVVSIHNKSDLPYPDVVGYYAPIGTASSFGVKYVATTRKEAPYGDCSTATEVDLPNYKGHYQVEACYRSCTQCEIIKQCACYYPGLPYAEGDLYQSCYVEGLNATAYETSSNNLNCIDNILAGTSFDVLKSCNCPQPCKVQTYATTISTAKWPSVAFTPNECTEKKQDDQPWMDGQTGKNKTKCLAWYKKNSLLIEVYYERMNYQMLNESPAYTFVACISEIAGQVGLFLGMSIISVFEFFTLLLLIFYYVTSHRSRRMELEQIEEYIKNAEKETAARDRKEEEKEAKRRADKLRKEADLYDDDHHESALPPKVIGAEL